MCILDCLLVLAIIFYTYKAKIWMGVVTSLQPSWCRCHSLFLASVKSRLVLTFWYRLTRVVLEKGPLNGCVCVFLVPANLGSPVKRVCVCVCVTFNKLESTHCASRVVFSEVQMASTRAFCSSVSECHWSSVASDYTQQMYHHSTSPVDRET